MGGAAVALVVLLAGGTVAFALDATPAAHPSRSAATAQRAVSSGRYSRPAVRLPATPPGAADHPAIAESVTQHPTADSTADQPAPPAAAPPGRPTAHADRPAEPDAAGPPAPRPMTAARPMTAGRLLAGVGSIPAGWVATAHTVLSGGLDRMYLMIEPRSLHHDVPVVVLMPGRDMTPDGVLHISDLADSVGPAVLVVPAGWDEFWNAGDCCGLAYQHDIDDVAFIQSVVKDVLAANRYATASEVYAIGFSNGGRLAYHLACDLPGTFTAFMAVEAVPVEACSSMRPIDITIVAQQDDPLLTVDAGRPPKTVGGFVEPTVAVTVGHMEQLDHCDGPSTVTRYGSAVEKTWACARDTSLHYVWYPGGAHTWRAASGATPGATDFALQLMGRGQPGAHAPPAPPGAEGRAGVGR